MHIVIVGPGALGSLLTARLAIFVEKQEAAGADDDLPTLSLLDYRQERAAQLRESGLYLEEKGQQTRCAVRVETDPAACTGSDVLFFCVKATAVSTALQQLKPYLSGATLFIAMQNGIGHIEPVQALPCISGVGITSEGATLLAPGHIRHGGTGLTRIGLFGKKNHEASLRRDSLVSLLELAGMQARSTSHPLKYLWAKLFVNVGINALTAIHRCPNGELLDSEAIRATMHKAVNEAMDVARAMGIEIVGDPVSHTYSVCEATATNISSMHQDVRNRKPTEIDAINGAVVAHGQRLSIPTPVNAELVQAIREIEAAY